MARANYRNLSIKMNPNLYVALEAMLKAHNRDYKKKKKKKVYKVRVIEDLIFLGLTDLGWINSNFEELYKKEMDKRPQYTIKKVRLRKRI